MIKTDMCDLLGIKHPIIQAGMGTFSNNKLAIAAANAGVLGLHSTSGLAALTRDMQREIYNDFAETAGANPDDDRQTILRTALNQTLEGTKDSGGIFGLNVMVSSEMKEEADWIIDTADRGTLVARGFVGPARWVKTSVSKEHQKNTLKYTPQLFLDSPSPLDEGALKLIENEVKGINAVRDGDEENALVAGGECAQRVNDLPKVQDLVDKIMQDAVSTIKKMPAVLQG